MRWLWLLTLMVCIPTIGSAQQNPITYHKERLILHPSGLANPQFARGVLLNVDVRQAGANNPDWLQLTGYRAGSGTLEVFPTIQPLHIAQQNVMSPVDVIAFNEFGQIVTIAPDLVLGALARPIERGEIVKAILYTKAGFAEEIGLTINDTAEYNLFIATPTIMDVDTAKQQAEEKQRKQAEEKALEEALMKQIEQQEQQLSTDAARAEE